MPSTKADLLLHPLRLRIVTAVGSGRATAKSLGEALPEVPQTSLYRHLSALVGGGILRVVEQTPVRGTVERTYALAGLPSLKAKDLRGMTKRDYEQAFAAYLAALMAAAQRDLQGKGDGETLDPLADGVELSLAELLLSDEEYQEMNRRILKLLVYAGRNRPAPGRRRRTFSYLFIPQG